MAVADQIARIQTAKENIKTSLSAKGVDVGDAKLDEYSTFIDELEVGGGDLSEYFGNTITGGSSLSSGINQIIKKIPNDIIFSVTSGDYLFYYCQSLTEIPPLSALNIKSAKYMFQGCQAITTVPNFNTSLVTNMTGMFYGCSNLIFVPNFDTSSVTNMSSMFQSCFRLTSVPNFNTSSVTNMTTAFYECRGLTEFPALNTSKVTNMQSMFESCNNLETIPELDAGACSRVSSMFTSCSKLTNFGGLKNLGQAYLTSTSANNSNYKLNLSSCTNLTHDSLMNVINNLYDIATKGCNTQQLILGATNLAKLTDEEIKICTDKGWSIS